MTLPASQFSKLRKSIALMIAMAVLSVSCIAVETHPTPPQPKGGTGQGDVRGGKVSVLSVDKKPIGEHMTSYTVLVGYENDTRRTPDVVVIRCRFIDPQGFQLAVKDMPLNGGMIGPLRPGFKTQTECQTSVSNDQLTVSCEILDAR